MIWQFCTLWCYRKHSQFSVWALKTPHDLLKPSSSKFITETQTQKMICKYFCSHIWRCNANFTISLFASFYACFILIDRWYHSPLNSGQNSVQRKPFHSVWTSWVMGEIQLYRSFNLFHSKRALRQKRMKHQKHPNVTDDNRFDRQMELNARLS